MLLFKADVMRDEKIAVEKLYQEVTPPLKKTTEPSNFILSSETLHKQTFSKDPSHPLSGSQLFVYNKNAIF